MEIESAVLTTSDLNAYVCDAMQAGASGFLHKDAPSDQLVARMRTIAAGHTPLAPTLTDDSSSTSSNNPRTTPHSPADSKDSPQREVLVHIAHGKSNRESAKAMSLGEARSRHTSDAC